MDKKGKSKAKEDFREFTANAHEILLHVKGVFPFDIFPDEAKLDRQMLTIRRNIFPGISKTVTSHHDDILNSHLDQGPLFGSVTIHLKYVTDGEETIKWLSKRDAKELHVLLQGILSARKNEIDLTPLNRSELLKRLEEMGDTVG